MSPPRDGRRWRVAVLCDYPEEGWPSMDLTGAMTLSHLAARHADEFAAARVCPPFRPRFGRLPWLGRRPLARNADRLANRLGDYPHALAGIVRRGAFDLYHVVDHSYSQLVHAIPPGRAVVTCHDLDTFRCLLDPAREPRPAWFRAMAGHILAGLRSAAAISCNSATTRDALLSHALIPAERLHVNPLGIHPECVPDPDPSADAEAARLLGPADPDAPPDLLHVGSNIPRKRVDVLLAVFAAVRRQVPGARLIKMGGALPAELADRARELGVAGSIVTLPRFSLDSVCDRAVMAAVYRRAALLLQPSEAEGFGLPVAEALACGLPVLASDIAALREVAGEAAVHRPVGDVAAWASAVVALLDERRAAPDAWRRRRQAGLDRARRYSWSCHADRLAAIYRGILSG
jgi:glycosyltransferase involved in cell wall biosynthesis